jgi:DNA-binding LacI/PurR family transcriptional regulator
MTSIIPVGRGRLAFFMEVAESAAARSLESDLALTIVPPTGSPSRIVGNLLIDGAIVVEPAVDDEAIPILLRRKLPVVTIGEYRREDAKIPYIDMKYKMMTRKCLTHLKEAGCYRIAIIIGTASRQVYREIESEYHEFCKQTGSPFLCERVDEVYAERGGARAFDAIFARDPMVDGLFVPLATFAVGARESLRCHGRRVPDDVKIMTRYDGIRARDCDPPLSAVDLRLDRVGEEAADLLLQRIVNQGVEIVRPAPDPLLVVRESTARCSVPG